MSSFMVSANHLACLADGFYQILTLVPQHFLSMKERDELISKFTKNEEFSPNTIYQKLYKLNKKAMLRRYSGLSESEINRPDNIPKEYDKYINIETQNNKPDTNKTPSLELNENWYIFSGLIRCYDYQCSGMGIENKKTMILINKLNDKLQEQLKQANIQINKKLWEI